MKFSWEMVKFKLSRDREEESDQPVEDDGVWNPTKYVKISICFLKIKFLTLKSLP